MKPPTSGAVIERGLSVQAVAATRNSPITTSFPKRMSLPLPGRGENKCEGTAAGAGPAQLRKQIVSLGRIGETHKVFFQKLPTIPALPEAAASHPVHWESTVSIRFPA